jgi:hypothetical protein
MNFSLFISPLTETAIAQDEEFGGLPPVLKACDEKGSHDGKIQREELPDRLRRFVLRYPKDREGLVPIVLLSHGGYGSSFGHYAYVDLATSYATAETSELNQRYLRKRFIDTDNRVLNAGQIA